MDFLLRLYPGLLAAALLLFLPGCILFTEPDNENLLTGDVYWEGEVRLTGEVVLAKDAVLTIAPGTRVLFMPYVDPDTDRPRRPHELLGSKMLIHGRVYARGTAYRPITFGYYDPDAPAGSWGGIKVQDAEEAFFYNCEFRQAMNAIHSCRSWVSIEYSKFENNKVGILFHNARLTILRNLFKGNDTGIFYLSGSPVISENEISGNNNGLVISDASKDYLIDKNSFLSNRSYNVGLGERVRRTVDLRNNYWGTMDPSIIENSLFDGRSTFWKGEVNYLPARSEPVSTVGVE